MPMLLNQLSERKPVAMYPEERQSRVARFSLETVYVT